MKMEVARGLIRENCVKFAPHNPFTYASGLKGPIYCDNRLILSHVDFRDKIVQSFLKVIEENFLQFDFVGGVATAGIPHAAFIADRLRRPMIYIRPKPKDHGQKNQVEGDYLPGQSVLLIEDLVNQGSSLVLAKQGLEQAGLISTQCLSIVDYQMRQASDKLNELSLTLFSLTDFEHLVNAALELQFIDLDGKKLLMDWHADPKEWSKLF